MANWLSFLTSITIRILVFHFVLRVLTLLYFGWLSCSFWIWITSFPQESTKLKVEDVQLSMDDLEMIQVIGKGSGGVVQLVRHKWVGTLYALKVISCKLHFFSWWATQLTHCVDIEYVPCIIWNTLVTYFSPIFSISCVSWHDKQTLVTLDVVMGRSALPQNS